jgi:hypothetical protein
MLRILCIACLLATIVGACSDTESYDRVWGVYADEWLNAKKQRELKYPQQYDNLKACIANEVQRNPEDPDLNGCGATEGSSLPY